MPGTHNFERENREVFYRMLGDTFFPGDVKFDAKEIPADAEVKQAEELNVPLPRDNLDFNRIALRLAADLPRGSSAMPASPAATGRWRETQRGLLGGVVRAKHYPVAAELADTTTTNGLTVTSWRLRMADAWTLPAVEFSRGSHRDRVAHRRRGRRALAAEVEKLLAEGKRVVAVDPFYFGESRIAQKDFLFALLVAAVGDRPLGLQASQLTAAARWLSGERKLGPVKVISIGPRASVFATVAAALEEKAIGSLEVRQPLGSLRELIGQNVGVNQQPELFCFGLLEQFDVPQLRALVAPRPVAEVK